MTYKFFQRIPKSWIGILLIIGSMLDAIAVYQFTENATAVGVSILMLRAGINKLEQLYTKGILTEDIK